MYLHDLGELRAAVRCYERLLKHSSPRIVSLSSRNLANVYLLTGHLVLALQAAEDAVNNADLADDHIEQRNTYATLGYVRGLLGYIDAAQEDFARALSWQHTIDNNDNPLYSLRGVRHALVFYRLGRYDEAARITKINRSVCQERWATESQYVADCNLILADIARHRSQFPKARDLLRQAYEWALARYAQELLCWSAMVRGRIALYEAAQSGGPTAQVPLYVEASSSFREGLRIAGDCGYAIYHIDLLLSYAYLCLAVGNAEKAERLAKMALFGADAPKNTVRTTATSYEQRPSQLRSLSERLGSGADPLFGASHAECAYKWGQSEAHYIIAGALLLRVAQTLRCERLTEPQYSAVDSPLKGYVDYARRELDISYDIAVSLQDPKAKDIALTIEQLSSGILTRYPIDKVELSPNDRFTDGGEDMPAAFDVLLSYNSKDRAVVRQLKTALERRGLRPWLDRDELIPGRPWQEALEVIIETAKAAAALVGKDGIGPWSTREIRGCLSEFVERGMPVIPVLLPGASKKPTLPAFLKQFTWVDLRQGLSKEGLDQLVWGIKGKKT